MLPKSLLCLTGAASREVVVGLVGLMGLVASRCLGPFGKTLVPFTPEATDESVLVCRITVTGFGTGILNRLRLENCGEVRGEPLAQLSLALSTSQGPAPISQEGAPTRSTLIEPSCE